ncbi:MAG: DUF1207 domain-containing protein [Spirochaetota bacterium]|nr:DUF1207 domain-containing protein [Spirochaetota bacterium]
MISRIFLTAVFIIFLSPIYLCASFEIFPNKKPIINSHSTLFNSFDGLDVLYLYNKNDLAHYMAVNFGVKYVIFHINTPDVNIDLSVMGRASVRFELFSESFNMLHADYLGGLALDVQHQGFISETWFYHISSHLGDDAIIYNNEKYVNAGWEAIRQYFNYDFYHWFRASLGLEYKIMKRPNDRIFYDLSYFIGGKLNGISFNIPLFIETEIEIINFDHSPNFGVKLGIYLDHLINKNMMDKKDDRDKHIIFISYYHGYSKIAYLYNRRDNLFILGRTFRY